MTNSQKILNFVEKRGDKWVVLSHDRKKVLATEDTKEAADKRLGQIEYFKHQNQEAGMTDSKHFQNGAQRAQQAIANRMKEAGIRPKGDGVRVENGK